MLAATLPRLASALFQPAVLAAGVATGVVAGTIGVGTGVIPVTDPAPHLVALFECPDSGRVVRNLPPNQSVLVTARSADGAWLQIYLGEAGTERGWARAASLQLKSAPDSLPIADCTLTAAPAASLELPSGLSSPIPSGAPSLQPTVAPSGVPGTVAPSPSTSPKPTKTPGPTRTPKPTATPLTGPVLSNMSIYGGQQDPDGTWRITYGCSDAVNYFAFTIDAADPDRPAEVLVYYKPSGGTTYSDPLTDEDGLGGLWDGYVQVQQDWAAGPLDVWLQGQDLEHNLGPIFRPSSEGISFVVGTCKP